MTAMTANGAQVVSDPEELAKLRSLLLDPSGTRPNTAWVGQDAQKILRAAGIEPHQDTRLVTMVTDPSDPFVQVEMLMPVVPVVPVTDYLTAIDLAVELEHGNRHTAIMHSKDVSRLDSWPDASRRRSSSRMGRLSPALGSTGRGSPLSLSRGQPVRG